MRLIRWPRASKTAIERSSRAYRRVPSADQAIWPETTGSWIRASRTPESTSSTSRWLPEVWASTCAWPGRQASAEKLARFEAAVAGAVAGHHPQLAARPVGDAEAARRPDRVLHRPRGLQRPAHVPAAVERREPAALPGDHEAPVRRPRRGAPRAEPPALAVRLDDPDDAGGGHQQPAAGGRAVGARGAVGGELRAQADRGPDPVGDRLAGRAEGGCEQRPRPPPPATARGCRRGGGGRPLRELVGAAAAARAGGRRPRRAR